MKTGRYLHYKGNYYEVVGTVLHSETEEELILYRSEKNEQLWVRPKKMFEETVLVDGKEIKRFLKVD
ncbi:MAG TPA: DUF1653 domain-containing protein [Cytophagaceae bacterium]|jgi:hypothetical protein|nr:DUF1653 domain-containing protein [Cytophagaceae bacterium]